VISPVLANIYLHEALDLWFEKEVKPRMKGKVQLYRYADDLIVTFEIKEDADKFMEVLPKRLGKFGLELHPDKTKVIEFGRAAWAKGKRNKTKTATFNFLGFTHYCGESCKGKFMVKVKTMAKRLRRGLVRVRDWCKENLHKPLTEQHRRLRAILQGHYAYYGRRNNFLSLNQFYSRVIRIWKKWLSRRSNDGYVTWNKLVKILQRYPLPKPRIVQGQMRFGTQIPLFGEFT
jgi:RNA-directed DNA polymerase